MRTYVYIDGLNLYYMHMKLRWLRDAQFPNSISGTNFRKSSSW